MSCPEFCFSAFATESQARGWTGAAGLPLHRPGRWAKRLRHHHGLSCGWQRPAPVDKVFEHLTALRISPSLRYDRAGKAYLRFSPHFYNTEAEMDRVIAEIARAA